MQNEKIAREVTADIRQSAHALAEAASSGAGRTREAVESGAQQAQAAMRADVEQAGRVSGDMMKATQAAAEFARGNFEALSRATQIYTAGIQDLGRQAFALTQLLNARTLEDARAVGSSKTPKEAADAHGNYLRQNLEQLMAESARLQDVGLRLAVQTAAPITQRIAEVTERLGKSPTR